MTPERNISIMGIVNITDDSFYQGSRFSSADTALEKIGKMLEEGADIIDIGACSTRPGAEMVGPELEWKRLRPVLEVLMRLYPNTQVSVDTCWSAVVEKVHDLVGDFIVNDISAGEDDPGMLPVVGKLGLRYIAMHKRGTPRTMHEFTDYESVTEDVVAYFNRFSEKAAANGIKSWVLDPGFGFAKSIDQNYQMLRELDRFREVRCGDESVPDILVGVSRKSMIYKMFDITPEESLPQTQVLHLVALQKGADILRVHDVAEARRTVDLYHILSHKKL